MRGNDGMQEDRVVSRGDRAGSQLGIDDQTVTKTHNILLQQVNFSMFYYC